jgi:hypothetical protein
MISGLIETGRYYGMGTNVEETEITRISREPSSLKMTDKSNWRMWNISDIWVV